MKTRHQFMNQTSTVFLACGLIASLLAGLAGAALPAKAGQRFTDDFTVPTVNWRYGSEIRRIRDGGLALSAREAEATLAGTAVHPDNLGGFAATVAWNTRGVTNRTLAIGWGKSAEWGRFDECTEQVIIGADGAVTVSAGGITLGTARVAVSAGGDAVLAFRRGDDAITVMADGGDRVFRLPAGNRTAAGYLAMRVQGGAQDAAPLHIRRVTIDCTGDLPPLKEAERAASNDRWAAERVRRNNEVLDSFERHLRAETAAGRWGFPTDLAVSPGLVSPGEPVRIVFRCKGELPEPCMAHLEPDYLGGSGAAARPLALSWRATGDGNREAVVDVSPERPGNWRVVWKAGVEEISRVFGVVGQGYTVCRFLITNDSLLSERNKNPVPAAHDAIHDAGLPADYWGGSEWESPFARTPENLVEHFGKRAAMRHRWGDHLFPMCNGNIIVPGCPDNNLFRLSDAVQAEGFRQLARLWDLLGFGPLDVLGSYTLGHSTPRLARDAAGVKMIDSLCQWQNWRDGVDANGWLINHWGPPAVPYFVADDDFRKVGPNTGIAAFTQTITSNARIYNVFTGEGDPQQSSMRRGHKGFMPETTNIDRFEATMDHLIVESALQSEPLFLSVDLENFVNSADWNEANRRGVQYLVGLARTERLVFATSGDIAGFFLRHYDAQPENWQYWPDIYAGYTHPYGWKPLLLADRIILSNGRFHSCHEDGAVLPRFLWDYTKPWDEPVWDDQQSIREKYGLVTPGLLTYRNCVPSMADLTDATAGITMEVESGGLILHATATLPRDVDALPLAVWRLPLEADGCKAVEVSEGARFVPVVDGSTGNLHGLIVCDRVRAGTHTWTIRLRGKASAPVKPAFHIGSNVAGRSFLRASGETTAYVWLDGPGAPDGILTVTVPAGRAASVKYNDGTTAAAEEGVLRVRLDRDWQHESPMITGLTAAEIAARGVFRAGAGKAQVEGGLPLHVTYEIPREAAVSLGLFDNQGRLLRHLIKGETRAAGRNQERWDGLDQWGNVIPAGQYQLKGAYYDPLRLEYVMTATNPGNPPWWTADGTGGWMSDQSPAQDIVTDGTNVYIAAPGTESGHGLIAVGPDGKRIWGVCNPSGGFPFAVSLALLGDRLYVMYSGASLTGGAQNYNRDAQNAIGRAVIMCYDKNTGRLAGPSSNTGSPIRVNTWVYREDIHYLWDLRLNKRFSPATYGGQHRYYTSGCSETTNALGLTAVGNRLVASMFYDNELLVLDPDSLEILKRIPLDAPAGLHGLDAQRLLAVSGKRVVDVNVLSGAVATVIDQGLSAPFGVTTGRDGTIYVSDWGDSFQVKAFDARGSLLRAIGKAGGRPWVGPWDAKGMAVPRGLAVTNDYRLWVAEDDMSPRRVSVWNATTGALIRDYIGPANYNGWGLAVDPLNPRRIITTGTEFMLDFEKKTYTPTRKMFLQRSRDDAFTIEGNGMGFNKIIYREGREFYVQSIMGGLVIAERRGDEYRSIMSIGNMSGTGKGVGATDLGGYSLPNWYPAFFEGKSGKYIWNDLNGDTFIQEDEVSISNSGGYFGPWWSCGFGPQWEIYAVQGSDIYRFDPEFTAEGQPRYSFGRARPVVKVSQAYEDFDVVKSLYASKSGKLYVSYTEDDRARKDVKNGIVCYDRDGNELWAIAHSRARDLESLSEVPYGNPNAEFSYPDLGIGVSTWEWDRSKGRVYLLAEDGLYLGGLLDIHGDLGSPFRQTRGNETSKYTFQEPGGRLYLVNGEHSAHHILEIQGLETAKRFKLPLTISEQDALAAAQAMKIEAPFEAGQPGIVVGRTDTAPPMDGTLAGWDLKTEGVTLSTDQNSRGGQFALKTDGTNLFFAARILDPTPMVNNGESWLMPFMTGDCVDLMLAVDPNADPGRYSPAPGDLRLLFTKLRGEAMAVLYRQSVPGTTKPVQFMVTYIDDVRKLPEATPVIRRQADGYTLTAVIPLASLGLGTLPRELRGDVGIIYGDATGRNRDQRLYYFNKHTDMVSDLSTEARLNPNEWGPIVTATPGNLIRNAGFEAELGDTTLGNWRVGAAENGATAQLTTKSVFAGCRSLFLKSAVGGSRVHVNQRVPVEGGRRYDLRLAYRACGIAGSANFVGGITWFDDEGREIKGEEAFLFNNDQPTWATSFNDRAVWPLASGEPYTAPANATYAEIGLALWVGDIKQFDKQLEVFIDQVEFAPTRR